MKVASDIFFCGSWFQVWITKLNAFADSDDQAIWNYGPEYVAWSVFKQLETAS